MRKNILRDNLNGDVTHSALNLMWKIIAGPFTMLLVPLFTMPTIQGFWYTFISLAALTIFADLGFTTIATQYVAHEFAFLTLDADGVIRGESEHLYATAALLRFVMKWGVISGLAVTPLVFGVGCYLFIQKAAAAGWLIPWIMFSAGTLVNYWGTILASFLQGARQVARVQRLTLVSRVVQSLLMFGLLILHRGLFALAVATLVGSGVLVVMLLKDYRSCLAQLFRIRSQRKWGGEILSLLWRYAISWTGGYLNLQVFTPLVFQFKGAVLAGKVGITLAIWTAAISFSTVWFSANIPKINILIARSEEGEVKRVMRELMKLTYLTYAACVAALILLLYLGAKFDLGIFSRIVARFMGLRSALTLLFIGIPSMYVNAMAIYLRAHKKEPLLLPSVVSGVATAILSLIVIRALGPDEVFVGFFASTVAAFPWFFSIYRQKRADWGRAPIGAQELQDGQHRVT
ncbi:MAG TPA: hypothetical protein VMW73_05710 [Spirochaetia bacterium]|nr:hypothetical protein [Spirochaetia bacterium]